MRGFETAGLTILGVTRKRRVAEGEGTVTPVRELTVSYRDGTKEELIPGLHRFDPSHALVRQRPELFALCCKGDRTSAPAYFRAMLARAERDVKRELDGDPAPTRRTYGRYQIRRPTRNKLR